VTGRDSEQLHGAGRRGCDELLEVLVKTFDLVVERRDPLGDGSERELRGVGGAAELVG